MASDSCSEKSNQQDIFLLTGKAIFSAKLSVTRLSQSENQAKVLRSSICISGNSSSDRLTLKRESLLLNALILQIMTLDLNSLLCVKCVNHVLAQFVNNLTLDSSSPLPSTPAKSGERGGFPLRTKYKFHCSSFNTYKPPLTQQGVRGVFAK